MRIQYDFMGCALCRWHLTVVHCIRIRDYGDFLKIDIINPPVQTCDLAFSMQQLWHLGGSWDYLAAQKIHLGGPGFVFV